MTPEEERNVEVTDRWLETYNNEVNRMIDECYAPDCVVETMGDGGVANGREELRAAEKAILAAIPDRQMTLRHRTVAGDTVVMEVIWHGTRTGEFMGHPPSGRSQTTNSCTVLVLKDGLIVRERAYMASRPRRSRDASDSRPPTTTGDASVA